MVDASDEMFTPLAGVLAALVRRRALTFRFDDCRSYSTEPASSGRPLEKLNAHLPARIVARPKSAKPWSYKLHVSPGAFICVERDEVRRTFIWRLERQAPRKR